jgi:PAS domain S-box-containing protein
MGRRRPLESAATMRSFMANPLKRAATSMNIHPHLVDLLRRWSGSRAWSAVGAWMTQLLSPSTPEERERRRAHLFALLLVAVVATVKLVTGVTDGSASYTLYVLAIAVSALRGGFAPACVATMASVLLAGAHAHSTIGSADRMVFALEGLGVAALVAVVSSRVREADTQLAMLHVANDELRGQARRGEIMHQALQHLEEIAPEAAVFLVNARGLIVDWPRSAERMYGYTAEQIVGSSLAALFSNASDATDVQALLAAKQHAERACRPGLHRRPDGTDVQVEFEVKPCRPPISELYTMAVHDLSRRRESETFRAAALSAQATLQKAADESRGQLAVLESLTDPSVNPVAGLTAIGELVERLRSSIRADGIALVHLGRTGTHVVSGAGLQPARVRAPGAAASSGADEGRVALVHNDATRVAQVSALTWPPTVSSIMVVPVSHAGQTGFRIEVVNERRAPATEWDLALARIVADRLSQAITPQILADSGNAVA